MADKKFTVTLTITVPENPALQTEGDIESELKEAMVDAIENTRIEVGTVRELATEPEDVDREQAYRNACQRLHVSEGDLEMDDTAVVSEGDDPGAYVQVWKWVHRSEAGIDDEEEEDEQDGG